MSFTGKDISNLFVAAFVGYLIYSYATDEDLSKMPYTGVKLSDLPSNPVNDTGRVALNDIIELVRSAYRENHRNEAVKGELRRVRGKVICETFPTNKFKDWSASLESYSTSTNGRDIRHIRLRIGDHVTITPDERFERGSAVHNLFLDGLGSYPVFTSSSNHHRVLVSGEFRYDLDKKISDCFSETSTWMSGGMQEPNFSIKLTSMQWIRDDES